MRAGTLVVCALAAFACAGSASAWGDFGHEVTALIAYRHLKPIAKQKVDALLAGDTDALTPPDFASRATWADQYAKTHRETSAWHFMNMEIGAPDMDAACYGFPHTSLDMPASAGPAQDCIVNKITAFSRELGDPATTAEERRLAFKFLIHFVGDLHQPLHVADNRDRGGNCIRLSPSPDGDVTNLHLFWDITAVKALGTSPASVADELDKTITPAEIQHWAAGDVVAWANEAFAIARRDAYDLPARPTCADTGVTIALTPAYQARAVADARKQLEVAGIRLATLLNADLGR